MIYCSTNNNRTISGNLGNMCMRIMSMMGMAERYGTTWAIPPWPYGRYFENEIPQTETLTINQRVQERSFHYTPEYYDSFDWNETIDISGFFQSWKYWGEKLKFTPDVLNGMIKKYSFRRMPIAISVRRGDFVGHEGYAQLSEQYYLGALDEHFSDWKGRDLFIFSDDIGWCMQQFSHLPNAVYIDEPDILQLAMMSLCSDFIISNSTFSFVGAWLAGRGKVVRPVKNFSGSMERRNSERDYWPGSWVAYGPSENKIFYYDKTYVISLIERPDRRQQVSTELNKQGIDFCFFNAIKRDHGVRGLLESMREVFKSVIHNDYKNIMVLEDDVEFLLKAKPALDYILPQLPKDYHLLYLGLNLLTTPEKISDSILRIKKAYATHAIIYSRAAIDIILPLLDNCQEPYDIFLVKNVQPLGHCYCTYPMIATQRTGYSDIEKKDINWGELMAMTYRMHTKSIIPNHVEG